MKIDATGTATPGIALARDLREGMLYFDKYGKVVLVSGEHALALASEYSSPLVLGRGSLAGPFQAAPSGYTVTLTNGCLQ